MPADDEALVLAAFARQNLTVDTLIERLDDLSRNAVKATKDGPVEDSATRLAATRELSSLLQLKLTMKARALRKTKAGTGATDLREAFSSDSPPADLPATGTA